jgi:hypothetical protein
MRYRVSNRITGMIELHPKTFYSRETYRFYIGGKDLFSVEPVLLPACDPDQVSRHQTDAWLVRAGGPAPYWQTLHQKII